MNLLAEIGWSEFLNGTVGFVGATILFLWIYVKFVLPRDDRRTLAIERLADAVKIIMVDNLQQHGVKPEDIVKRVEELRK